MSIITKIPDGKATPGTANAVTELYFSLQRVLNWQNPDGTIAEYCLPKDVVKTTAEFLEKNEANVDAKYYAKIFKEKGPMNAKW